jgi:hypothetical protein
MKRNQKCRNAVIRAAVCAIALLQLACGENGTRNEKPAEETPDNAVVEGGEAFIVSSAPEGAVGVARAREQAGPGADVVLRGKVGGRTHPFVEGRAAFVLADETAITSCDDKGSKDTCPTPWDYCCEDPDTVAKATATVQLTDDTGAVRKGSVKGLAGIKELSVLVVAGTVNPASGPGTLVVDAKSIFVEKP